MGAEVLRNTFTNVALSVIRDQLGRCTSGECEIIDLFGFWSLLFDYMHHDQGVSVQDKRDTDDVRIQLGLDLEPTASPVDLAEILLACTSSVGSRRVDLLGHCPTICSQAFIPI